MIGDIIFFAFTIPVLIMIWSIAIFFVFEVWKHFLNK